MPQFHFVEDYKRHVAELMATYSLDEAMSRAVGGSYEQIGLFNAKRLIEIGLKDGQFLIDLGCGSGRLSTALSTKVEIEYLGTDVVPALLDYAASRAPTHYKFVDHPHLSIPAPDASADMVIAFSLFTHLLHEETFVYLEEAHRVLNRTSGKLAFSFLEFAREQHWAIFASTVAQRKSNSYRHLNTFIERSTLSLWAKKIGFEQPVFREDGGQTLAILNRLSK